jgi:thiosulfate/3-mercaptopyruvate sulfurtransferase
LEADEKYAIDRAFLAETHADLDCFDCHEGTSGADGKETAHSGLVSDPSDAPAATNVCTACHSGIATDYEDSVHYTLSGYATTFEARSGLPFTDPDFQSAFTERCEGCHVSCGQCHVSRPDAVRGGLVDGHRFLDRPSQNAQCTACHGSRINDEFKGLNANTRGDVHYLMGFDCIDCHRNGELHGGGPTPATRRDVPDSPSCAECHPGPADGSDGIGMHVLHLGRLDCPVCHAQVYKNCYQCHVGESGATGHGIQHPSELDFRIGLNPIQDSRRPWDYVLLRHVPVYPEMYEAYGIATLSQFTDLPTWKYATPHNIRLNTPQNASCEGCHDEPGRFLTAAYLDSLVARGVGVSAEAAANASVVTDPPASPPGSTSRR